MYRLNTKEEITIGLWNKYGKIISNVFVVLLVVGAIIVKSKDESAAPIFQSGDAYLLAGAVLAFILIRLVTKKKLNK